jgi:hypothetical protein
MNFLKVFAKPPFFGVGTVLAIREYMKENPVTGQRIFTTMSIEWDDKGAIAEPSIFTTMSIDLIWKSVQLTSPVQPELFAPNFSAS